MRALPSLALVIQEILDVLPGAFVKRRHCCVPSSPFPPARRAFRHSGLTVFAREASLGAERGARRATFDSEEPLLKKGRVKTRSRPEREAKKRTNGKHLSSFSAKLTTRGLSSCRGEQRKHFHKSPALALSLSLGGGSVQITAIIITGRSRREAGRPASAAHGPARQTRLMRGWRRLSSVVLRTRSEHHHCTRAQQLGSLFFSSSCRRNS